MVSKDLRLENNDLFINPITGDFQIIVSDDQHIEDLINAFPGWYKQHPEIGAKLMAYVKSSGKQQELTQGIRQNVKGDGYIINFLEAEQKPDGTFQIEIDATKN